MFNAEQLNNILRQMQSTHGDDFGRALFEQEYYVSFDAAIPGSIWGDLLRRADIDGRITSVAHDPDFPVHTAWDLGRTDDTAIWFFQLIAGEIYIIDYHASSLKEIEFYADVLRGKSDSADTPNVTALKERTKTYAYGTHSSSNSKTTKLEDLSLCLISTDKRVFKLLGKHFPVVTSTPTTAPTVSSTLSHTTASGTKKR